MKLQKIITYETLKSFAYVNDKVCNKPINGIVISFFGLGGMNMYDFDTIEGEYYAKKGILYVIPYNNPWSWMNKQAVAYTDEIIDVLIKEYNIPENVPIVSSGGSMGGLSALVYTVYSKRTPIACVANCPVCDAVYHYSERPDLPRTMYSALFNETGTMEDALKSISPLHLIDKMPRIRYHIFHCTEDKSVNKAAHSDKLIDALKEKNHTVTYDIQEGRGHCKLSLDMQRKYAEYIEKEIMSAVV